MPLKILLPPIGVVWLYIATPKRTKFKKTDWNISAQLFVSSVKSMVHVVFIELNPLWCSK